MSKANVYRQKHWNVKRFVERFPFLDISWHDMILRRNTEPCLLPTQFVMVSNEELTRARGLVRPSVCRPRTMKRVTKGTWTLPRTANGKDDFIKQSDVTRNTQETFLDRRNRKHNCILMYWVQLAQISSHFIVLEWWDFNTHAHKIVRFSLVT
jgi:hypothetical protein